MIIKNIIFKKTSKVIVDLLLLIGLVLSIKTARNADYSWGSYHCIISWVWYALILVHIWQHWHMTKVLVKWKVMKCNIITILTVFVFILMTFSVILFVVDIDVQFVRIHHIISHIFWAIIIIHTIQKSKRFINLFKRNKK